MPAARPFPKRPLLIALLLGTGSAWLAFAPNSPLPADLRDFAAGLAVGAAIGLVLMVALRTITPLREWVTRGACESTTPTLRRRYMREFIPAMTAYVVVLPLSVWLLKRIDATALRALVALLPAVPIAFVLRALIRHIRGADELQRQIELEAVSLATALVSMLYVAGGFLQLAKVIDIPAGEAMIWVFPLVCLCYGLSKAVVARRFH